MSDAVLEVRQELRASLKADLDGIVATAKADGERALSPAEQVRFDSLEARIRDLDAKIVETEQADEAARVAAANEVEARLGGDAQTGGAVVKREESTYHERSRNSFLKDMAAVAVAARRMGGTNIDPTAALERLQRSQRETAIDYRNASKADQRAFDQFIDGQQGSYEARVNPNTTDGTGGEFVPPLWLVSQYIPYLRATRTFANRVKNMPLPPGTDSINLPKITTGSLTAPQTSQGSAVTSQDIVTSSVSATVRTIAGQEDISLQLLEQSPISMDGVIFDDLARDYDMQLDRQVVYGTNANGQHKGLLVLTQATSNTDITKANGVTVGSTVFHDASTANTQYRSLLNGVNQIETLRYASPTAIWAHPRRINSWRYSAVSSTYTPLFSPTPHFNALGTDLANVPEGIAGELLGLPVVKDANMPTTMNSTTVGGGTADPILILKEDDIFLWEGALRMRVLPEILSGTLQVRFQVYAYSAFMPDRFPAAVSILTGNTGLAAPGF